MSNSIIGKMTNLDDFLSSSDPLTKEVALFLLTYAEEDNRVDYKRTVDLDSDKEWLGLTKDISAFANTRGGYLVFGVEDRNKEVVGLSKKVENVLKDSNNLQLKINRHLEPDISTLRSKAFCINGKMIVLAYVPQSHNVTHLIKKDGVFKQQSGEPKTVLHQGTFYVRRSAGNHLGDSRDLDDLIERRIDQFRDALIDKVARVVKSPAESSLLILSKNPEDGTGERFIIEDSPDSIPVKGLTFTVPPGSVEEEVAAWTVLSSDKSNVRPPPEVVWNWYLQREALEIRPGHKLSIFQFSLWVSAPTFYWIQGLENSIIRKTLLNAIRNRPMGIEVAPFLVVASFLGKATYTEALKYLGTYIDRIAPRMKTFPTNTPMREFCQIRPRAKETAASLRGEKLKEINGMATEVVEKQKKLGVMKRSTAQEIDCYLYAQENNYK